jgi:hypothetical protein
MSKTSKQPNKDVPDMVSDFEGERLEFRSELYEKWFNADQPEKWTSDELIEVYDLYNTVCTKPNGQLSPVDRLKKPRRNGDSPASYHGRLAKRLADAIALFPYLDYDKVIQEDDAFVLRLSLVQAGYKHTRYTLLDDLWTFFTTKAMQPLREADDEVGEKGRPELCTDEKEKALPREFCRKGPWRVTRAVGAKASGDEAFEDREGVTDLDEGDEDVREVNPDMDDEGEPGAESDRRTGGLLEKGKAKEPKRKRVDAEGQGQELLELLRACVGTAQGLSPTQPPVEIKLGEEFSSVLKKMNKTLESVARAQGNGVDSDSESDDGSLVKRTNTSSELLFGGVNLQRIGARFLRWLKWRFRMP